MPKTVHRGIVESAHMWMQSSESARWNGQRSAPTDDLHALDRPFSLIHDPVSRHAAAYDALNRLITPQASPELLMYAISMNHRKHPWDEEMWAISGTWWPLPAWLRDPGVRARCTVYYCRNGNETIESLLAIPPE